MNKLYKILFCILNLPLILAAYAITIGELFYNSKLFFIIILVIDIVLIGLSFIFVFKNKSYKVETIDYVSLAVYLIFIVLLVLLNSYYGNYAFWNPIKVAYYSLAFIVMDILYRIYILCAFIKKKNK